MIALLLLLLLLLRSLSLPDCGGAPVSGRLVDVGRLVGGRVQYFSWSALVSYLLLMLSYLL